MQDDCSSSKQSKPFATMAAEADQPRRRKGLSDSLNIWIIHVFKWPFLFGKPYGFPSNIFKPIHLSTGLSDEANKQLYESSADVEVVGRFEDMGLKEDLLRGIYAYGNIKYQQFV